MSGTGSQVVAPAPAPAPPARKRSRRRRRILLAAVAVIVLGTIAVMSANVIVTRAARAYTYDDVASVPKRSVAIVFGAYVSSSRHPSPVLGDRIREAVELYRAGKVGHLLMTGDSTDPDNDEVTAMREMAMELGVPSNAITRDYAGLDTYDSCARAKKVFGVADAILVTQDFHLARALFLCRGQSIDAVGLAVPDWQHLPERAGTSYPPDLQRSYMAREWLARAKAFVEGRITRPNPTIGNPYEGLQAN